MPGPASPLLCGALLFAAACSAGCNAGPAEEAIAAAEVALEAARPTLEAQAPGELAELERVLAEARVAYEEGRYTDALRSAQSLPSGTRAAVDAILTRSADPQTVEEMQKEPPGPLESTPAPESLPTVPPESAPPAPDPPAPVGS